MITNKDIRVENGFLVINGDKFPLDGQSPETIMDIVEDNSDTTPTENSTAPVTSGGVYTADKAISDTIGDITQTGVTGATVAAQLSALNTTLTNKSEVKMLPLELSFSGGVADFTKSVVASDMDYPISVLSYGGGDFYLVSLQNALNGVYRVFDAKDPSASGNKELRIVYKTVN